MTTYINNPDGTLFKIEFRKFVAGGSFHLTHINSKADYTSFVRPLGYFSTIEEATAYAEQVTA